MGLKERIRNGWLNARAESSAPGNAMTNATEIALSSYDSFPFDDVQLEVLGLQSPRLQTPVSLPDGTPYERENGRHLLLLVLKRVNDRQHSSSPDLVYFDFLDIYAHRQEIEGEVFSSKMLLDTHYRNMSRLNMALGEALKEIRFNPDKLGHLALNKQ